MAYPHEVLMPQSVEELLARTDQILADMRQDTARIRQLIQSVEERYSGPVQRERRLADADER